MHPLVRQLYFARSEFVRGLQGLSDEDAQRRIEPMNSISWNVGHLASQEQTYWLLLAQGKTLYPDLHKLVGYGSAPNSPSFSEMWAAWQAITEAADSYLERVSAQDLVDHFVRKDRPLDENVGTLMLRNIYHYWYHTGESAAIRQTLGHRDLPQFVGDMSSATYLPEG